MADDAVRAELAARTLDDLSAKVTLNLSNGFAGCFALVPPGGTEPVTMLILDPDASPAIFWSLISSKAKMALDEIAEEERNSGPMGGFGRTR
jgi:hypothetical protein